uniref:FK506-binding protein 15 n=1 Tax=Culex pipiens TaxID=7175 RepID=A0A8D8DZC1_CULPI
MLVGGAARKGHQSDDDDDFFKPTANSTLAKIFGISKPSNAPPKKPPPAGIQASAPTSGVVGAKVSDRYGASSFRYVPPAPEPDPVESQTSSSSTTTTVEAASEWNLLQASVVTAYKLVNNENTAQGKLGIALLSSGTDFKILLYRSKTDALATLNISTATKLFLKQDYLQFQSDDDSFWSVLFEAVAERDRLLATVGQVCSVEQEKPPPRPVPASRTTAAPIVEEPESDVDRSNRASLISRMARVGQPILPQDKAAVASTTEVDSSDTDAAVRIETIPRHRRTGSGGGKMTIGMQMVPSTALSSAIAGQNMLQTAADCNFNMFMAENRMQGTEVRMNLSKLESKLDRVLDKIDLLNVGGNSAEGKSLLDKDEDILALEEKVLELKKENHALKGKVRTLEAEGKSIKENSLAKEDLLEAEEKCRELGEKVAMLERELKTSQNKSNEDRAQFERKVEEISLKDEVIEGKTKEVRVLEEQLQIAQSMEKETSEANAALQKQIESLKESLNAVEQQLEDQKVSGTTNKTLLDGLVKDIMNNCYQRLSERIEDGKILKIIGQTIKQETKAALDRQLSK